MVVGNVGDSTAILGGLKLPVHNVGEWIKARSESIMMKGGSLPVRASK